MHLVFGLNLFQRWLPCPTFLFVSCCHPVSHEGFLPFDKENDLAHPEQDSPFWRKTSCSSSLSQNHLNHLRQVCRDPEPFPAFSAFLHILALLCPRFLSSQCLQPRMCGGSRVRVQHRSEEHSSITGRGKASPYLQRCSRKNRLQGKRNVPESRSASRMTARL